MVQAHLLDIPYPGKGRRQGQICRERQKLCFRSQPSGHVRHLHHVWLHTQTIQMDHEGYIAQDAVARKSML